GHAAVGDDHRPEQTAELDDVRVRAVAAVGHHAAARRGGDDDRVVPLLAQQSGFAAGVDDSVIPFTALDGQLLDPGVVDRLGDGVAPGELAGRLHDVVGPRRPVDG